MWSQKNICGQTHPFSGGAGGEASLVCRGGPSSLRSAKIPRLLIHQDLPTSVAFGTGISSSLRPLLLWAEQALLMLPTELIRPFLHPSPSPSSPPVPVSRFLPLTHGRAHKRPEKSCSCEWTWLTQWMRHERVQTLWRGPSGGYRSLGNSSGTQWADSLAAIIRHLVSSLIHKSGTLVRHARRVVGDLHGDLWEICSAEDVNKLSRDQTQSLVRSPAAVLLVSAPPPPTTKREKVGKEMQGLIPDQTSSTCRYLRGGSSAPPSGFIRSRVPGRPPAPAGERFGMGWR